jgi:cell division protein FtsN
MNGRTATVCIALASAGTLVLGALCGGCAPRGMTGNTGGTAGASAGAGSVRRADVPRDTAAAARASYDIEDEMPEKSPQRAPQLVERLEPAAADSITVQDVAVEETPKQRFDVGYRVQVFASGDRAAAEKVKERIVAETSLKAYIEYEDGLYKVRAGDFTERKDAAQARSKLAGTYPGSWIVRTTIRR